MKTNFMNLAIFTLFSSFLMIENLQNYFFIEFIEFHFLKKNCQ